MEEILRTQLLDLAKRYGELTNVSLSAAGKLALNDNTVFSRLAAADMAFSVRTYDRLVQWFFRNWPSGAEWPTHIRVPAGHIPPKRARKRLETAA